MKIKNLIFVTGNNEKAEEAKAILGLQVKIKKIKHLPEIQSMDLDEVVREKAKAAFEIIEKPLLVDDVAFYIDAWKDFPGPFIRFMIPMGVEGILKTLENETNRKVLLCCGIGYHDGKKIHVFIGKIKGKISKDAGGKRHFGFDPIFIPNGGKLTYAQMGFKEKNLVSHRAKALEKLKKFLERNN